LKLNIKIILNIIGLLVAISGGVQLLCLGLGCLFGDAFSKPMLWAGLTTIAVGLFFWITTLKANRKIKKKEGYLIVTLTWLSLSLMGTLPFLFTGYIPVFTDAFFETVSGFTATGATILNNIEGLPNYLLFWRSVTAWIGGMGIIVLTVAILPILGIGGMQLFVAEATGPTTEKLHPRIQETAKRIWYIYVFLTFIEVLLLKVSGLTWFDAINHAMTNIATSGFSTRDASIAAFDSALVQYIIILFMFIGGTNFVLIYFAFKRKFKKVLLNEEFRFYVATILLFSLLVSFIVYNHTSLPVERVFRDSVFQVISIITTTGYVTADYTSWSNFGIVIFFVLFFTGACAGSTSGGAKLIRHLIVGKNILCEFRRQLHSNAIIPVRYGGKVMGSLILACLGENFESALGASAACIGNVGPAIGKAGPVSNFSEIHWLGKWLLSFFMILGRLELFTVLVLFTPYFWKQ